MQASPYELWEGTHEKVVGARKGPLDARQLGVGDIAIELHGDSYGLGVGPRLPKGTGGQNSGGSKEITEMENHRPPPSVPKMDRLVTEGAIERIGSDDLAPTPTRKVDLAEHDCGVAVEVATIKRTHQGRNHALERRLVFVSDGETGQFPAEHLDIGIEGGGVDPVGPMAHRIGLRSKRRAALT